MRTGGSEDSSVLTDTDYAEAVSLPFIVTLPFVGSSSACVTEAL